MGILLPQCPETGLAHIALYKLGAVAVPLFTLFGPDALVYRLNDSEARGIITDAAGAEKVLDIRGKVPSLKTVVASGGKKAAGTLDFWDMVNGASERAAALVASRRSRGRVPGAGSSTRNTPLS